MGRRERSDGGSYPLGRETRIFIERGTRTAATASSSSNRAMTVQERPRPGQRRDRLREEMIAGAGNAIRRLRPTAPADGGVAMGFRMRKSMKIAPGVRLTFPRAASALLSGVGEGAIQSTPPVVEPSPREEASSRVSTTRRASAGAVRARAEARLSRRRPHRRSPACSLPRARRRSTKPSRSRTCRR